MEIVSRAVVGSVVEFVVVMGAGGAGWGVWAVGVRSLSEGASLVVAGSGTLVVAGPSVICCSVGFSMKLGSVDVEWLSLAFSEVGSSSSSSESTFICGMWMLSVPCMNVPEVGDVISTGLAERRSESWLS